MRFSRPLSASDHRRIRLQLALVPLYVWIVFTWSGYVQSVNVPGRLDAEGLIKGHDFVHFYVLGTIALERQPGLLYDYEEQAERTHAIAGPDTHYLPVYGPQVAVLFAPLALFSYDVAWKVWIGISAVLYLASCWFLWRSHKELRPYAWVAFVATVGFPPFSFLIGFGHITSIALAAFAAAYLALRARHRATAGFALGCLFLKPPLGLVLPVVMLYGREWRVLAGAAAAVLLQLAIAAAWFGPDALREYVTVVLRLGELAVHLQPQPHQMQSLRSFFSVLLAWPGGASAAYFVTAAVVLAATAWCWRAAPSRRLAWSALLLAAILVNPHVNIYDLVVLAPMYILVAAWMADRPVGAKALAVAAYAAFVSPIVGPAVSLALNVQVGVLALVVLWCLVVREAALVRRMRRPNRFLV